VWHKLRESKLVSLEGLQLSEMLQSFQPTRKPVPGRMSWLGPIAGEAAAGPASSEIKPLLTDSGNSQPNQANPLGGQKSESAATDGSSILPLNLPELPLDGGWPGELNS
jgi:hypothetical protein